MLLDQIKAIIDEHFIYEGELTEETKLVDDLGADSFDIPVLINVFEDTFKIKIETEDVLNLKTIGDLIKLIQDKI
ncbi:MAG: acyl carrier protein [Peptococcaceae bacterium]|nr:acyl carrier protein [Peptococcaceae bacterium]